MNSAEYKKFTSYVVNSVSDTVKNNKITDKATVTALQMLANNVCSYFLNKATKSEGYKLFLAQMVTSVGSLIKENSIEDNALAVQMVQQMANGICLCMQEALAKNPDIESLISEEHKSTDRCLKYVWNKASEMAIKNSSGYGYAKVPVMVTSDNITDWLIEYYELDDKAEVEEEIRKEEERKAAEAEKKAKKEAAAAKKKEKLEKDIKKAENLLEKEFAFNYKLTEKDIALFEKLRKEGVAGFNNETKKWFIKDIDDTSSAEDVEEEIEEDDEELDFID